MMTPMSTEGSGREEEGKYKRRLTLLSVVPEICTTGSHTSRAEEMRRQDLRRNTTGLHTFAVICVGERNVRDQHFADVPRLTHVGRSRRGCQGDKPACSQGGSKIMTVALGSHRLITVSIEGKRHHPHAQDSTLAKKTTPIFYAPKSQAKTFY